jgi:ribosomal protein S18 acetylase RimI-like enzyme
MPRIDRTSSRRGRPVEIRPCRVADIPRVLALWKTSAAGPSVSDTEAALRRRLRRDRHLFLLAWDGDHLVGSLMGGWDGWRGSMARLAVDPLYRRRGIARLLLTRVEAELKALGAVRIGALVFTDNRKGRGFWKSSGYELDDETVRYTRDL